MTAQALRNAKQRTSLCRLDAGRPTTMDGGSGDFPGAKIRLFFDIPTPLGQQAITARGAAQQASQA